MHITAHIKNQKSFCSSNAWGNWTWNCRWKSKVQSSSRSLWHTLIRKELHNRFNERNFVFLTRWNSSRAPEQRLLTDKGKTDPQQEALRQTPWTLTRSRHTRGANNSLINIVFCFFCGVFLHKPPKGWPILKALQTIQNSAFWLLSSTWNICLLTAQFHIEGIRIRRASSVTDDFLRVFPFLG